MTTEAIYFLHIPKTAGSSIRAFLQTHFGPAFCPAGILDELIVMPAQETARYQVFAGHFHNYLEGLLQRPVTTVTVLRDPIARTRSHWHEVRRTQAHPDHERVRKKSFAAFVDDERNRVMIENYQARYLVPPPVDIRAVAERYTEAELRRYAVADAAEQASLAIAAPVLLADAKAALRRMAVVGVCEALHPFLVKAGQRLGFAPPPATMPRFNVTETDEAGALPPATMDRLLALTRIDQALYDATHRSWFNDWDQAAE